MYIIGGKHKKRRLKSPPDRTRPTASQLREAIFNICQQEIENARFLDLFAGSGAIGLEALSRGASHVSFVENERSSLNVLKQNIATLKEEKNTTVLPIDVFKAMGKLAKEGKVFDLIFADPPYGTKERSLSNEVIQYLDQTSLLSKEGFLFVEDSLEASQSEPNLSQLENIKKRKFGRALLRIYQVRSQSFFSTQS